MGVGVTASISQSAGLFFRRIIVVLPALPDRTGMVAGVPVTAPGSLMTAIRALMTAAGWLAMTSNCVMMVVRDVATVISETEVAAGWLTMVFGALATVSGAELTR